MTSKEWWPDDGHVHDFEGSIFERRCKYCGCGLSENPVDHHEPPMTFIRVQVPPVINTFVHLAGERDPDVFGGDVIISFHRVRPLSRFQIWMYKQCFGWRVRQEP